MKNVVRWAFALIGVVAFLVSVQGVHVFSNDLIAFSYYEDIPSAWAWGYVYIIGFTFASCFAFITCWRFWNFEASNSKGSSRGYFISRG